MSCKVVAVVSVCRRSPEKSVALNRFTICVHHGTYMHVEHVAADNRRCATLVGESYRTKHPLGLEQHVVIQ